MSTGGRWRRRRRSELVWQDASDALVHPRSSLRRHWASLNGHWEFALDWEAQVSRPEKVDFDRTIVVPFAPETPASGVGERGRFLRSWYRRTIANGGSGGDADRLLVWCNAADRVATVWVEGRPAGSHTGGYSPFAVDVTDLVADSPGELVVQVDDDPGDLSVPRGKQEWGDEPHAIWYPRTSGLWGEVWLERVPATRIASVDWSCDVHALDVSLRVSVEGPRPPGLRLRVRLSLEGRTLADDTASVIGSSVSRTMRIGDGTMDDHRRLVWWPRRPVMLDAELALVNGDGDVVDEVSTNTALRSVGVEEGRFLVNGRPTRLRFALDQGYWPESGATPPDVRALRRDIELTQALGFNGVRKHQKVEDPRYFALADRLGLMVWVELPSAYEAGPLSAANLLSEWPAIVEAHRGHPSVVAWVPANESWGVPNIEHDERQRSLVVALASVATALDGTRPVSANDGWEAVGGDIIGIHDYDQKAARLAARYATREAVEAALVRRRVDGNRQLLDAPDDRRAVVLSEFGGIALGEAEGGAPALAPGTSAERTRSRCQNSTAELQLSTTASAKPS